MKQLQVDRSAESRFGQRVIGSKAEVMWYYESVANHSLATPSASDSRRFAGANAIMVQLLLVPLCKSQNSSCLNLLTPFSRLRGGCGGGERASERCGAPIAAEETRAEAPRSGLPPPCVRGASGARARGGAPAGACFERTVCVRARAAAPCAQNRGAGRRLRGPIEAPQSARRGRAACGGIAARLPA